MNKIRNLAGETALYGLGSIVPRVINFFLIFPHTRVFPPEAFGALTDLYAWVAFLNVLFTFGMETTFFRFINKSTANPVLVFNQAQTIVFLISVPISLFFILFSSPIAANFGVPDHPEYIIWLTGIILLDAVVAIPFARLRHQKKPLVFASAKIVNVVIVVSLNFVFLQRGMNIGYVILFNLIGNGVYIAFFSKTLWLWRPAWNTSMIKPMIQYAYPIMLTGLAGMTNEMFSRISLRAWLPDNFYPGKSGDYALGIFGACYKYAVFMSLAVQSFRFAAEPFFFSQAKDKNAPRLFAEVNHYFIIVCCIILLAVSLNLDLLKFILRNNAYWEGLSIVPILLSGYMFLGIYYNLSTWFKLTDKTHYGTLITVGGALITILANYLLIPIAGYHGSSWATLICYGTMAITCYLLGQRHYPIPYFVGKGFAYMVASWVIIYLTGILKMDGFWISLAINNTLILIFAVIAFIIERNHLRTYIPNN